MCFEIFNGDLIVSCLKLEVDEVGLWMDEICFECVFEEFEVCVIIVECEGMVIYFFVVVWKNIFDIIEGVIVW